MLAKTEKLENLFICKVNIHYNKKEGPYSFNPRKCAIGLEGVYLQKPKEPKTNWPQYFV